MESLDKMSEMRKKWASIGFFLWIENFVASLLDIHGGKPVVKIRTKSETMTTNFELLKMKWPTYQIIW